MFIEQVYFLHIYKRLRKLYIICRCERSEQSVNFTGLHEVSFVIIKYNNTAEK